MNNLIFFIKGSKLTRDHYVAIINAAISLTVSRFLNSTETIADSQYYNSFLCFMKQQLQQLLNFYESYQTRSYQFRKQQLQKLKSAVLKYQQDFYEALYADLKKSTEESWVTEIGFLVAEINHALKHLHSWMKPQRVATNLMNLPSKSLVYKEPLGVVLIIGPWNYPLHARICFQYSKWTEKRDRMVRFNHCVYRQTHRDYNRFGRRSKSTRRTAADHEDGRGKVYK